MEELLKQILAEVKDMKIEIRDVKIDIKDVKRDVEDVKRDIKDVKQGQSGLNDKVQAFESQVNNRFNSVEKKLDTVYSVAADLVEFRIDTEQKLKKVK